MALTFYKEPEEVYPAYNDSFIEFSSDLADNNRAEITVYPTATFTRNFVIYPDADGKYLFNLKESVKVVVNANGFEDTSYFNDKYYASITDLYLYHTIKIKVYSDASNEELYKTYNFIRSVKQIGEKISTNDYRLLSYSPDGVNHKLTYFEGFPFYFDIQRSVYVAGRAIIIKNLNTTQETDEMPVTSTGAFRVNVDRGEGKNWNTDNILILNDGLNRLEIWANEFFKSNLILDKRRKRRGVYLKWFNSEGGYSHFLFDEFYSENVKGSDLGIVSNTDFANVNEVTGTIRSTGKEASRSFVISVKYNQNEYEVLKSIFISPYIQVYTSTEPDVAGRFVDVAVNGTFSHNNKKEFNKLVLTVQLPEMITAKY